MTREPINEINKAYYPLIARIALFSIALDALFFVIFVVSQATMSVRFSAVWIIAYLVKLCAFIYFSALAAYHWTKVYYSIETEKGLLIKHSGLNFPTETSYSLKNLHSVSIKQNIFSGLLKYGDMNLVFTNREGNKEELKIIEVVNPETYKYFFEKYLGKS